MDQTQRLELKNQALLEKVSSLTTNYENQIADLRVELTVVSQELQHVQQELASAVDKLNGATEGDDEVPSQEAPANEQD